MTAFREESEVETMYRYLEHPEITCALRTGYPSWMQDEDDEVLNDEDDEYYDSEFWGDECEDRYYEEALERAIFGD